MVEPVASREAFEVSAAPAGRAILHLKSWVPASEPSSGFASAAADARLLTLGPGEWLMVSDSLDGPGLQSGIEDHARSLGMAAVDVSQGTAALRVSGRAARDVLSMGCGLDLGSDSFPADRCARTRLAQLAVVIDCRGAGDCYELYVGASYRDYLRAWLEDAAAGWVE